MLFSVILSFMWWRVFSLFWWSFCNRGKGRVFPAFLAEAEATPFSPLRPGSQFIRKVTAGFAIAFLFRPSF
jgi:hypothetical protein